MIDIVMFTVCTLCTEHCDCLYACKLNAVLAGTLAYGINMPCRTVAFAGDHIFLNSLQFCQMSGRAGRRGYDTLGHVIFMNVPQRKVESLMVSPVPQLHGNFPLSVTLALRALTLQGAASHDPEVTNDMLRLLQKPFFASEDPRLGQKMKHLFSFDSFILQQKHWACDKGFGSLSGMCMSAWHASHSLRPGPDLHAPHHDATLQTALIWVAGIFLRRYLA